MSPVNLRVVRVADLEPRRATAKQPIRTLRQLRYKALAIALADGAEEIDAATDYMVSAERDIAPTARQQVVQNRLALKQRHVAQVATLLPHDVERMKHGLRLMPKQRFETGTALVVEYDKLAVDDGRDGQRLAERFGQRGEAAVVNAATRDISASEWNHATTRARRFFPRRSRAACRRMAIKRRCSGIVAIVGAASGADADSPD